MRKRSCGKVKRRRSKSFGRYRKSKKRTSFGKRYRKYKKFGGSTATFMSNYLPRQQMSYSQSKTGMSPGQMMSQLRRILPSDRSNFYV